MPRAGDLESWRCPSVPAPQSPVRPSPGISHRSDAMSPSSRVESIFFAALEKKMAAERVAYLDEACGDDPALRLRVERLLDAHPEAKDFLAEPAIERFLGDATDREPHPRGLRPDPDPTCDLVSSGAVSTNGPSTHPAPGPEVTGEFDPELPVTKEGLGQDDDRAWTLGRLPSTLRSPPRQQDRDSRRPRATAAAQTRRETSLQRIPRVSSQQSSPWWRKCRRGSGSRWDLSEHGNEPASGF